MRHRLLMKKIQNMVEWFLIGYLIGTPSFEDIFEDFNQCLFNTNLSQCAGILLPKKYDTF